LRTEVRIHFLPDAPAYVLDHAKQGVNENVCISIVIQPSSTRFNRYSTKNYLQTVIVIINACKRQIFFNFSYDYPALINQFKENYFTAL